jgi:aldose 1-epimerase
MTETLQSKRATAIIDADAGGRLVSLIIDGHEIIATCAAPDNAHDWYRGSFPLAPWVGVLADAAFFFEGERYEVDKDFEGKAVHGLVAERAWHIIGKTETTVLLDILFGPLHHNARWPMDGHVAQTITITDTHIRFRLEVYSDSEAMPASAGYHPWFSRVLAGSGGAEASISFQPSIRLVTSPATGRRVMSHDLGEHPWDDLFIDLEGAPTISWPGGPTITLTSNAKVWVYYERTPGGFCIEPWSAADDTLSTSEAHIVTPGHPLVLDFIIDWSSSPTPSTSILTKSPS